MGSPGNYPGRFLTGENLYGTPENKAAGGGGGGDGFAVEDLLNFPNEEEEEGEGEGEGEEEEAGGVVVAGSDEGGSDGAARNSSDTSTLTATESCSNSFSPVEAHFYGDLVCSSLAVSKSSGDFCETQYDELAELEWLSTFVEESFSSDDFHNLHLITAVNSTTSTTSSSSPASSAASSSSTIGAKRTAISAASGPSELGLIRHESPAIPAKARSKRSRATPSSWFSRLLVPRSPAALSSPDSELVALPFPPAFAAKKSAGAKKKETQPGSRAAAAAAEGRKCLHCQTDKTPQWRTGPMGPKTLCNACGVRYKSGRLVPEYRPAASPTFVYSEHSNSHRKVLELRRQKEIRQQLHSQAGDGTSQYDPSSSVSAAGFLIDGPDNNRRFI